MYSTPPQASVYTYDKSKEPRLYRYFKQFRYANDRELEFLKDIEKRYNNGHLTIHELQVNETPIAFIAINAGEVEEKPAIIVDYLFVDRRYRGRSFEELQGLKASQYLFNYLLKLSLKIRQFIGIYYIALYPDQRHPKLLKLYESFGFLKLSGQNWMIFKVNTIKY